MDGCIQECKQSMAEHRNADLLQAAIQDEYVMLSSEMMDGYLVEKKVTQTSLSNSLRNHQPRCSKRHVGGRTIPDDKRILLGVVKTGRKLPTT